jgi:hypothetical protein
MVPLSYHEQPKKQIKSLLLPRENNDLKIVNEAPEEGDFFVKWG